MRTKMRVRIIRGVMVSALSGIGLFALAGALYANAQPKVEVVFCLDTTGSMGGLIEGAKQKIWSIANQIVSGKPTPALSIGLVAYRDFGDEYVTKIYQLDDDLDAVFERLRSLGADGGGDTPEHVNRALHDAVRTVRWSNDPNALRLVFLVGDCPPHMDYGDGYDYREICKAAVQRDIVINAVQCGDYPETASFWRDIAKRAEGSYASIAQDGGMQVVETPFDAEIAALGAKLEDTRVPFGSSESIASSRTKKEKAKEMISGMAPAAAAERASFKAGGAGMGAEDLVRALETGAVKIEALKDEELPEEMRGKTLKEKETYLSSKEKERTALSGKIEMLSRKRTEYLALKLKETGKPDSFDGVVKGFIEDQAAKKGIAY
jgi:hypothetical protein